MYLDVYIDPLHAFDLWHNRKEARVGAHGKLYPVDIRQHVQMLVGQGRQQQAVWGEEERGRKSSMFGRKRLGGREGEEEGEEAVSYTHLRAHETEADL
eukprot:1786671-Rhodomonas_salina.1